MAGSFGGGSSCAFTAEILLAGGVLVSGVVLAGGLAALVAGATLTTGRFFGAACFCASSALALPEAVRAIVDQQQSVYAKLL
jgi:hypothetical protein